MAEKLQPQFFADTSSITEINSLMKLGIFSGITTNPLIVAKEAGRINPMEYYQQLAKTYPDVPISIQLLDGREENLLEEAHKFAAIASNIVVKVPMFGDGRGVSVAAKLSKEGIRTNVTALMDADQLTAVILTNPTYLSLFFNRIKDGQGDPIKEIENSRKLIDAIGSSSKIITGSIRMPSDIREALVAGSHIVTIPPARIKEMIGHPQSELFIKNAQSAWDEFISSQGK